MLGQVILYPFNERVQYFAELFHFNRDNSMVSVPITPNGIRLFFY